MSREITTTVWITTTFKGYHRWKEAPDSVAFLRNYHRHLFHVKIGVSVSHTDKDVEFFTLKDRVRAYINNMFEDTYFDHSCKMIAIILLNEFNASFVEVSEDGENGVVVRI